MAGPKAEGVRDLFGITTIDEGGPGNATDILRTWALERAQARETRIEKYGQGLGKPFKIL